MLVYHGTAVGNINSIKRKGLIPNKRELFVTTSKRIAQYWGHSMSWESAEDTRFAVITLSIPVQTFRRDFKRDPWVKRQYKDSFVTRKKISPLCISRIEYYSVSGDFHGEYSEFQVWRHLRKRKNRQ